jgi:hypothetical protein
MSKLSSAFKLNDQIRTKTFEIKGNKFTVKVPTSHEKLAIDKSIYDISEEEINAKFHSITDIFRNETIEGVEITDDDVIVNGVSSKDTVVSILQMEKKILKYFQLLIPEEGTSEDFTYADIEAELPLQLQLEILEHINEAIEPNYREARKN